MLRCLLLCLVASTSLCCRGAEPPVAPHDVANPDLEAARKAFAAGHAELAIQQLDRLAALDPEPAGVDRLRGFIAYQQRNMAAAEAAFAKAAAQDSSDRESVEMRGVALYSLGRPAEAVPFLESARVPVPEANVDPDYVLGACYLALRRYDEARRAFAAQYGFSPDSAPAYLLIARLLLRQQNVAAATEFTHKALSLAPELPLAHLLLGEIALGTGQLSEAISEFNRERELNSVNGTVYERLGDAYLRAGDDRNAQEALGRALLLEPNAAAPYILLGQVMLNQKNYLLASLYLERATGMDPASATAHKLLAQVYSHVGRAADAQREQQAAERLQPNRASKTLQLQEVH